MLDKMLGSVLGSVLGNNSAPQGQGNVVSDVLQQLLRSQGGVQGIFAKLQQDGLGGLLDSWIGTGSNQTMTRNEVSQTFGQNTIEDIAQQTGISTNQTEDIISQVLPSLIDMLTPNGRQGGVSADNLTQSMQAHNDNPQDVLGSVLGSIFGGSSTQGETNGSALGDLFKQILNTPTQTSQTQEESSNDELAKDINAILNNFFK
ncbi:YidB family protein [Avibacterium sp. 20-15]|uniref:YidB family protein n=1 Tax=unclassified Avibacterium TaxID=2685287 RepID=UPI002026B646|nr:MULTISPECIES: YidB family protein [unclassified Avibacterium]MCW9732049.1 YidB family protein [Avibacterium sp. 20-15]URL04229.1 YidB family protein [Avibacterium sp. 20-132]